MTFRKAARGDEPRLLQFLERHPHFNLFLLGNLARFGIHDPDCEFWLDEGADGRVRGAINRRMSFWAIGHGGSAAAFDASAAAAVVDACPPGTIVGMTGVPDEVDPLLQSLRVHRPAHVVPETFAVLDGRPAPSDAATSRDAATPRDSTPSHVTPPSRGRPRRAEAEDVDALTALYDDPAAGRMRRSRSAVDRMITAGAYLVEEGGLVVCAAALGGETETAAMIGAVYTPERFRRRGYASSLVRFVCEELVARGKRPCLFYANPDAGGIYRRLGFRDVGPWRLVDF